MAFELKQGMKLGQSLVLSPQIQQAIKILTLSRHELEEMVAEELRQNPCLEEGEAQADSNDQNEFDTGNQTEQENQTQQDEPIPDIDELLTRFKELPGEESLQREDSDSEFDTPSYERINLGDSNLHDEIEEQLRLMHLTEYEFECTQLIVQYLDDNGFLTESLEFLAQEHNIPIDDLEYALKSVKKCEPAGVGARNLQECLMLQLKQKDDAPPLAKRIIESCWPEFEKQDFSKISKALNKSTDRVKEALIYIREHLDPRPARQYGGERQQTISPDVFIFRREQDWIVSLNEDGLPRLKISSKYENIISTMLERKKQHGVPESAQGESDKSTKEFINDSIKSARAFVKALADRNKTILRVTEVILEKQKRFFEEGAEHLRPLTLKAVADELGLHESTISRSTNNKYVHTPQGLFELKHFFNSGMSTNSGGELANEVVKSWVAECIKLEPEKKPLSDQDISEWIQTNKNVKVARRTVAKYRESLGILPSSKRARRF